MGTLQSVCVYCGSGTGLDPAYAEAARVLGRAMAAADLRLIYGGGSIGLMGIVARSVIEAGGEAIGIIPEFLLNRERRMDGLTETVVTDDMHERKRLMFERADAFVALPGGVGTLEELVEQMTWAQLGRHQKPVLVANIGGFWNALVALLDQMQRERFIRSGFEVAYSVVDRAEDIVPTLLEAALARPQPALNQTADAEPIRRM